MLSFVQLILLIDRCSKTARLEEAVRLHDSPAKNGTCGGVDNTVVVGDCRETG